MAAGSRKGVWIGAGVAASVAVALYLHFDVGRLLTLENLKASRDVLVGAYQVRPLQSLLTFFGVYVLATALSIPGALILTLAGGAMFGLGVGLLVVSFASSLGALFAFLAARYLLRDTVQSRLGRSLAPINEGVRKDGTFYLLTLRLVPVFPFWLVNLLMGLTPIGAGRFYLVSQIGMLAGTALYVNAGTQLAAIESPGGHPLADAVGKLSPARHLSAHRQDRRQLDAEPRGLRQVEEAGALRPQPGRHRRGRGRPRLCVHRRRGEGRGHPDRRTQDGR